MPAQSLQYFGDSPTQLPNRLGARDKNVPFRRLGIAIVRREATVMLRVPVLDWPVDLFLDPPGSASTSQIEACL